MRACVVSAAAATETSILRSMRGKGDFSLRSELRCPFSLLPSGRAKKKIKRERLREAVQNCEWPSSPLLLFSKIRFEAGGKYSARESQRLWCRRVTSRRLLRRILDCGAAAAACCWHCKLFSSPISGDACLLRSPRVFVVLI